MKKRFKHKLNMLEPGTAMLKWADALLLAGLVLLYFHAKTLALILLGISGALIAILVILLGIEAHQDRVLNEIASREERQD